MSYKDVAKIGRLQGLLKKADVDNAVSSSYVSRGGKRTAAQFAAGGSAASVIAWVYSQVTGRDMPVEIAVTITGLLSTGAAIVWRYWEQRRALKITEQVMNDAVEPYKPQHGSP